MWYISAVADWTPITTVADLVNVNRLTLRRWVNAGKLKAKPGIVDRRPVVLVSLTAARKLVGNGLKMGRPKKKG
jgi:hypothetical protein